MPKRLSVLLAGSFLRPYSTLLEPQLLLGLGFEPRNRVDPAGIGRLVSMASSASFFQPAVAIRKPAGATAHTSFSETP